MRKNLVLAGFFFASSTSLGWAVENYNIHQGWNLLGAVCDIQVSQLNNSNIITVWKWVNNSWQAYSPYSYVQSLLKKYKIKTLSTIKRKEGFWINAKKAFTLTLCSNQSNNASVENEKQSQVEWLVLIYMAGDSNLSEYTYLDLQEIQKVKFPKNIKVVALVDNKEGSFLYETNENGKLVLTKQLEEINTGNAQTLENFVETQYKVFKPKKTILIMWDHGDSWRGVNSLEKQLDFRMVAYDEEKKDMLHLYEFKNALQDLKNKGVKLDIIGFDECFVGSVETLSAIKDFADYFVASESLDPGTGWDYEKVFQILALNPSLAPEKFAREIVDVFIETYKNFETPVTLAMFRKNQVELLYQYIDQLAQELLKGYYGNIQNIYGNLDKVEYLYEKRVADLKSFLKLLQKIKVTPTLNKLMELLNSLYFKQTKTEYKEYGGISIYLPMSKIYLDQCYFSTPQNACVDNFGEKFYNTFYQNHWVSFLKVLYGKN